MSKSSAVLSVSDWTPSNARFMQPKVNERGGKSISIISNQSNRGLHISLPFMNTWGISDFVDEKTGESDGKFSISLSFPSEEYSNPAIKETLEKIKEFENFILDSAVKNSEAWWGEEMERAVAKHSFYPILKYSKNKDTKKIDYTKPPTIRAKVPFYDSRWNVEIFDIKSQMIFPSDDGTSPIDHIPPKSQVACVLQCGGIWIGGKGWGLTWKLFQCVVKKNQNAVSLRGVCNVYIPPEETTEPSEPVKQEYVPEPQQKTPTVKELASVVDSDDEDSPQSIKVPEPVQVPVTVEVSEPEAEEELTPVTVAPVKKVVKKVVKK
jgi:hypothetical protein